MSGYAGRAAPPRTLTRKEAARLLALSGKLAEDYADHVLFSIALGTGLRVHEIAGLQLGDLYRIDVTPSRSRDWTATTKTRVVLRVFKGRARCDGAETAPQEVMLGVRLRAALDRFWRWRRARCWPLMSSAPLYVCAVGRPPRHRRRTIHDYTRADGSLRAMSARRMRERFREWADLAGLAPELTFHSLRHTFCQRLYEQTRDVRLVQRAARHAHVTTTSIYASASADDVLEAVNRCER